MERIIFVDSSFKNIILFSKVGKPSRKRVFEISTEGDRDSKKVIFCGERFDLYDDENLENDTGDKNFSEIKLLELFIRKKFNNIEFDYIRVGLVSSAMNTYQDKVDSSGGPVSFGVGVAILSTPIFEMVSLMNKKIEKLGLRADVASLDDIGKISLHEYTLKSLELLREKLK